MPALIDGHRAARPRSPTSTPVPRRSCAAILRNTRDDRQHARRARSSKLHAFLADVAGFSDTARTFLERERRQHHPARPAQGQPIAAAARDATRRSTRACSRASCSRLRACEQAFRDFILHINLEPLPEQPRAYTPATSPAYGDRTAARTAAACPTAAATASSNLQPAAPVPDVDDGVDDQRTASRLRAAAGRPPSRGTPAPPAEQTASINALAAPVLGVAADQVPDSPPCCSARWPRDGGERRDEAPRQEDPGDAVKLIIFIVVTTLATGVLASRSATSPSRDSTTYKAVFTDATGVVKGDDVRIAGVRVGSVKERRDRRPHPGAGDLHGRRRPATLTDSTHADDPLPQPGRPALHRADPGRRRRRAGCPRAPRSRSRGPSRRSTSPCCSTGSSRCSRRCRRRTSTSSPYEIIQVFQGEGGTLDEPARPHRLADQHPGRPGPGHRRPDRQPQRRCWRPSATATSSSSELIIQLQQFVGGLAEDRDAILGSLDSISDAGRCRPPTWSRDPARRSTNDIKQLRSVAGNLDRQPAAELDRALQVLPIKLDEGRPDRDLRLVVQLLPLRLPGQRHSCPELGQQGTHPVAYNTNAREVRSRMSIPFRERNPVIIGADQPRRDRGAHPRRLQGRATCRSSAAATPTTPPSPRPAASSPTTRSGSPASGSARSTQRRAGRRPRRGRPSGSTSGAEFGTETGAAIRVKTLLGAMYLALEPAGPGQLNEEPRSRVVAHQLAVRRRRRLQRARRRRSERIDTDQLAQSLDTLGRPDQEHPRGVPRRRSSGVSRLSANVAARDEQLNTLLDATSRRSPACSATATSDIVTLMQDGDLLFRALVARREAIHNLLVATSRRCPSSSPAWSSDTRADLKPALDQPRARGRRAQQEPGQPRQQPAADGAVLPGLRQHARQRPVVRHLHPEPAARSRSSGG